MIRIIVATLLEAGTLLITVATVMTSRIAVIVTLGVVITVIVSIVSIVIIRAMRFFDKFLRKHSIDRRSQGGPQLWFSWDLSLDCVRPYGC